MRRELLDSGVDAHEEPVPSGLEIFTTTLPQWGPRAQPPKREIHVFGEPDDLVVVGGGFSAAGHSDKSLRRGGAVWGSLKPRLTKSRLDRVRKGNVLKCYVRSCIAYSCKTWAAPRRQTARLQSFFDSVLGSASGMTLRRMRARHLNAHDLPAMHRLEPLHSFFHQQQLMWLGHVLRMSVGTRRIYPRMFLNGIIEVGSFERRAPSHGGRITAAVRSMPEHWTALLRARGQTWEQLQRIDDLASAGVGTRWKTWVQEWATAETALDWEQGHHHSSRRASGSASSSSRGLEEDEDVLFRTRLFAPCPESLPRR